MHSSNPPLPPQQTLPTMYDLPSEDLEESGLPDEFHTFQPQLLRETFNCPDREQKNLTDRGDRIRFFSGWFFQRWFFQRWFFQGWFFQRWFFQGCGYWILLVLLIGSIAFSFPAEAVPLCRTLKYQTRSTPSQVCIVSIQRSAKYGWEYRVQTQIKGVKQPTAVYDCRDRTKVGRDRVVVPFSRDGVGNFICKTVDRSGERMR